MMTENEMVLPPSIDGGDQLSNTETASNPTSKISKNNQSSIDASTRLRNQIDFYFSPLNLSRDGYLVSILQQTGGVMIGTIASFPKVREITSSLNSVQLGNNDVISFIANSLRESQMVMVTPDGQWIIPRMRPAAPMTPMMMSHPHHPRPPAPALHPPTNGHFSSGNDGHTISRNDTFPQQMPIPPANNKSGSSNLSNESAAVNDNRNLNPPSMMQQQQQNVGNGPPVAVMMPSHGMYMPMPHPGPAYFPYGMPPPMGMYPQPQPHQYGRPNYGNGNRNSGYGNRSGGNNYVNGGRYHQRRSNRGNNTGKQNDEGNNRRSMHSNGEHHTKLNQHFSNKSDRTFPDNDSNDKKYSQRNNNSRQGGNNSSHGRRRQSQNNENANMSNDIQKQRSFKPTTMDFPTLADGGDLNYKRGNSSTGNYAAALLNKNALESDAKENGKNEGTTKNLVKAIEEISVQDSSVDIKGATTEGKSTDSLPGSSGGVENKILASDLMPTCNGVSNINDSSSPETADQENNDVDTKLSCKNFDEDIASNEEVESGAPSQVGPSTVAFQTVKNEVEGKGFVGEAEYKATTKSSELNIETDYKPKASSEDETPIVQVQSAWGSKRLFADVVKQQ